MFSKKFSLSLLAVFMTMPMAFAEKPWSTDEETNVPFGEQPFVKPEKLSGVDKALERQAAKKKIAKLNEKAKSNIADAIKGYEDQLKVYDERLEKNKKTIEDRKIELAKIQEDQTKLTKAIDFDDENFTFQVDELNKVSAAAKDFWMSRCKGVTPSESSACNGVRKSVMALALRDQKKGLTQDQMSKFVDNLKEFRKGSQRIADDFTFRLEQKQRALETESVELEVYREGLKEMKQGYESTLESVKSSEKDLPDPKDYQSLISDLITESGELNMDNKLLLLDATILEEKADMDWEDAEDALDELVAQASARLDDTVLGKYIDKKIKDGIAEAAELASDNIEENICQNKKIAACLIDQNADLGEDDSNFRGIARKLEDAAPSEAPASVPATAKEAVKE